MTRALVLALGLVAAPAALASGGDVPYHFDPDAGAATLQRGARDFMHYCSGCHSLRYLRYGRLGRDLEIPEELLKNYLMLTTDKPGETIVSAMPAAAEQWFGRKPPDLSLTTRLRGPSWVYSYLMTFYVDPSKPSGVNNCVLPGASMPHVLWELQGLQQPHDPAQPCHGKETSHGIGPPEFVQLTPGKLKPKEYEARVADVVNFMAYAAEPGRQKREAVGMLALFVTFLFTGCAYLLKREYWRDVH
jgi:ubiquinol-cytochrome c reductase cytochrome c1 subunit